MSSVREQCSPAEADWYVEIVMGTTFCPDHGTKCRRSECERRYGTDTADNRGFFKGAKPTVADQDGMVPDGWYRLESVVKPCR